MVQMSMLERENVDNEYYFSMITNHKNLILLSFWGLCLLTVYIPIFKTIYESSRDFGRSLMNV